MNQKPPKSGIPDESDDRAFGISQELGGKSPNIILEDADMKTAVTDGVRAVMTNSGQSCNAPTRMLVPQKRMDEVIGIAKAAAEATTVGDPNGNAQMGPVVSDAQWKKIQGLIQKGIDEGATLVAGGTSKPEGIRRGSRADRRASAAGDRRRTAARRGTRGTPGEGLLGPHLWRARHARGRPPEAPFSAPPPPYC